jgi:hypothetical protein
MGAALRGLLRRNAVETWDCPFRFTTLVDKGVLAEVLSPSLGRNERARNQDDEDTCCEDEDPSILKESDIPCRDLKDLNLALGRHSRELLRVT